MNTFNLETATPAQLDVFAIQCRLAANEKTVLLALYSVGMFLNERNIYHVESNLKDALNFATPRLKAMKKSIQGHLPYIRELSLLQHKEELKNHFNAFCNGVKAS